MIEVQEEAADFGSLPAYRTMPLSRHPACAAAESFSHNTATM
jgi:hypothetical protein